MLLIQEERLQGRLQKLLEQSTRVDVAMAWIRCGQPLDAILDFAAAHRGKVRVLCGVNSFLTEAAALVRLHQLAKLKIAYGTVGKKFHTKLMLFHRESAASSVWVGSANLTESAFSVNRELVCEVEDNRGVASQVFESYWDDFDEPDDEWLSKYGSISAQIRPSLMDELPKLDAPKRQVPISADWKSYVIELQARNAPRLDRIAKHLPEVTRVGLSDWQNLNKQDAEKLLGIAKGFGGLGSLQGAGAVKNIFYEATWKNLKIRQQIADALNTVDNAIRSSAAAPSLELMVRRAFELVTGFDNIKTATVTRLLAVRHPERFVSVNGPSVAGFSRLSGISQSDLYTAKGYVELIRWVMKQPWWNTDDPMDETSLYWRQRAALLDVLVYEDDRTAGTDIPEEYSGESE